jgi:hypothetical protein
MKAVYSLKEILDSQLVKNRIKILFQKQEIELIERPASVIIKLRCEPEDKIFRIILLPPQGFSGNTIDETNPHPEARQAKIEIKGGIRPGKTGFNFVKNVLKYQYYTVRNVKIKQDEPYPKINGANYKEDVLSSRRKFFIVKENGTGFYHSLANLSNEWILIILEKELRLQKTVQLEPLLERLNKYQQKIILSFYDKILKYGDKIFKKEADLVRNISTLDVDQIIPLLIEMLNVLDAGKHEACTIYAIILKIGKKNKNVINYLREAIKNKSAPRYYLDELIKKLT